VDLERGRIFLRTWQYVGRTAQVAEVGDYFTATVLDLPVVVVRGEHGLGAFVNVCRHLVMSGEGNKKVLRCPYHAWTYGLDGCLKATPRSDREKGFDKSRLPPSPPQARYVGSADLRERWRVRTTTRRRPRPVTAHHRPERPRSQPTAVLASQAVDA
jgi:phenylpropionate dioxygenase-like ring-hydroxylating dioxygenase large terminal subunit